MKHYSQLTLEKRYGIYSLLKTGQTQSKIAEVISVHKSTVSRELKRNSGKRGYRPKQADAFAKDRQQGKSKDRIDNRTIKIPCKDPTSTLLAGPLALG